MNKKYFSYLSFSNPFLKVWFFIIFSCIAINSFAQPSNDDCSFATTLALPPGGAACFNSTSTLATADVVAPNVCNAPTGGNEVWYSYVATGVQNSIVVYPSGFPAAQQVSVSVYAGACGSALNVCNTAINPNDTAQVGFTSSVGTQIWFEVSGLIADGNFTICISSFDTLQPPPYSLGIADSCTTPIHICDKSPFATLGPTSFSNSGTYLSCYPFGLLNDIWFSFDVGKTGTLEWIAQPLGAIELDWEVIDISAGCPGTVVACNMVVGATPGLPTGMSSFAVGNCTTSQICFPVVVNAGNTYVLHINNYSGTPGIGFSINWGGTFEMSPNPEFVVNVPSGCPPLNTGFTNTSFGATSYNWVFGNGNTSAAPNPVAQNYNTPGTYIVTLTVSGSNGCSHSFSQGITVQNSPPASSFYIADTTVCIGAIDTLVYTGNASINATYNWNVGGATIISGSGQGPLVVQWNTTGVYTVTLDVNENGCFSSVTSHDVTVIPQPVASINMPAGACTGDTILVMFSGTASPNASFFWNYGNAWVTWSNGTDSAYMYWSAATNDSVYLMIIDNGCFSNVSTNYITIQNKPTSTFVLNDTACSGTPVVVTYTGNAPGNATYNWNFGTGVANPGGTVQGPQNVIWNGNGYYVAQLTVTENGCSSTVTEDSVYLLYAPSANFSVSDDSLCGNETATITFNGTAGLTATYNWNFNGANIISGSGAGPYVLNWVTGGLHFITLDVNESGCSSQIKIDSVYQGIIPTATAGNDAIICAGDVVAIGSASTPGYVYQWTPSNGLSNATISNPIVNLPNAGTTSLIQQYIITVTQGFCSNKDTVVVTVNPKQLAAINVTPSITQCEAGNNFNFVCSTTSVTGGTFNWDLGAAANIPTSILKNVIGVQYNAPGNYLVTLTTSTPGCPDDMDTITISINETPSVGFLADSVFGCPPRNVIFTDTSNTPVGSTYYWDFGNGDHSTLQNPTYLYSSTGVYNVSLTVTSPNNCSATFTQNSLVNISPAPTASFTYSPSDPSIVNPVIQIQNTSLNDDSCVFYFGDGSNSNDCNPGTHEYADTGTYVITLITYNAGGCTDTIYHTVYVKPFYTLYIPRAFTPNDDALNETWQITGLAVAEFHLMVFDRSGMIIFESNSIYNAWNGKDMYKNLDVQQGVYVFTLDTKDTIGRRHSYKGNVTVVR